MVKLLFGLLLVLLVSIQYQLWVVDDGATATVRLQHSLAHLQNKTTTLRSKNNRIEHEIRLIRDDSGQIKAHARTDLGMIQADETFYRFK